MNIAYNSSLENHRSTTCQLDSSKQVFPFTLDLDNPAFTAGLKKLLKINREMGDAKASGGLMGKLRQATLGARAGIAFLQLYMVPVKDNELPNSSRLQPAW